MSSVLLLSKPAEHQTKEILQKFIIVFKTLHLLNFQSALSVSDLNNSTVSANIYKQQQLY